MKYLKGQVNRLNSLEREIFFEYHFDGKTVERIAKDHQMNINTVKAKLARSRKKLIGKENPSMGNRQIILYLFLVILYDCYNL